MINEDDQNSSSSDEELDGDLDLNDTPPNDEGGDENQNSDKPNKRSAQARIDELTGELKGYKEKLKLAEEKANTPPPPPPGDDLLKTPQAQKAIEYLETLGFTRKGQVDEKIKQIEDRIALDTEHQRLSGGYDGSDGRPKYERVKVEEYMRSHAVYDPEVAYKAMNEDELLDWALKKAEAGTKRRPYVEKPGGGGVNRSSDNQITKEKLQEVAQNPTPANREWYERNRNKILQMMSEGQL